MISSKDLRIAELPLQKLSVVVAMLVLVCGAFILFLIAATQKIEQRTFSVKSGGRGFTPIVTVPLIHSRQLSPPVNECSRCAVMTKPECQFVIGV